jgi:hypothetical protein
MLFNMFRQRYNEQQKMRVRFATFCPNLPRGKKAENQQCTRCLLLLSLLPSSAAAGHAGHGIGVRGDQPEAHGDVGLGEVRQARR